MYKINGTMVIAALGSLCLGCSPEYVDHSSTNDGNAGQIVFRTGLNAYTQLSGACYSLTATKADGSVLWQNDFVCSGEESAGLLEQVFPCDGDSPYTEVLVELHDIYDQDGRIDPQRYVNPCPPGESVCRSAASCVPGGFAHVAVPITVLESNDVELLALELKIDSVTCTARVDCFPGMLDGPALSDLEDGRLDTAVLSLACETNLCEDLSVYFDDLALACDLDGDGVVEPALSLNPLAATGPIPLDAEASQLVRRGVIFSGETADEQLQFLSVALGLSPELASTCVLKSAATVSHTPLVDRTTAAEKVHPYIEWQMPITTGQGELVCTSSTLNGPDGAIQTRYAGQGHGPGRSFQREERRFCGSACADGEVGVEFVLEGVPRQICYAAHTEAQAYEAANTACADQHPGGTLAYIPNAAADQVVLDMVQQFDVPRGWIGLQDKAVEGQFVWETGAAVSFTNWGIPQPDDHDGIEDCTEVMGDAWNDNPCGTAKPFVCSYFR